MPPPPRILDSHIHLWPHTSTTPAGHAWMAPGGPLTKQHSLSDYSAATATPLPPSPSSPLRGAVYVETDRTLAPSDAQDVLARAAQPLDEIAWLRRLVTGTPAAGEAFAPGDGAVLWGLVPWAPVDGGVDALRTYLARAEEVAGAQTWARVRGFRFLVQGLRGRARFDAVVGSEAWVGALRELGRRGWCFDVGVDARGGGVWQVERAVEVGERVNGGREEGEAVRFVLSEWFSSPRSCGGGDIGGGVVFFADG